MSLGRWILRIMGVLLALAVAGMLWWLRPAPAEPVALAVLQGQDPAVAVTDDRTLLTLAPTAAPPSKGFVFYPGGLVDPRAYARILAPIAAAGYLVAVPKMPYDLAITDLSAARSVMNANPQITWWAVGGHSLGGAAASQYLTGTSAVTALVLWGSYPLPDLSDRDDLAVLSVSGSEDGLATPQDIAESAAKLPVNTEFVTVDGGIHAFFGDYGEQRGDGEPQVAREVAQQQIVAATLIWLNEVSARR